MIEVYLQYAVVQVCIVQILINESRVRKIFDISNNLFDVLETV